MSNIFLQQFLYGNSHEKCQSQSQKRQEKTKTKTMAKIKVQLIDTAQAIKNIPTYHYQAQARNIVPVMVFLIMSARGCISVSNSLQMNMNLNYKIYREYCEN